MPEITTQEINNLISKFNHITQMNKYHNQDGIQRVCDVCIETLNKIKEE